MCRILVRVRAKPRGSPRVPARAGNARTPGAVGGGGSPARDAKNPASTAASPPAPEGARGGGPPSRWSDAAQPARSRSGFPRCTKFQSTRTLRGRRGRGCRSGRPDAEAHLLRSEHARRQPGASAGIHRATGRPSAERENGAVPFDLGPAPTNFSRSSVIGGTQEGAGVDQTAPSVARTASIARASMEGPARRAQVLDHEQGVDDRRRTQEHGMNEPCTAS